MQQYFYKMIDQSGNEKKGTFSANNRNEVIAMIKNHQCYPVSIEPLKEKKGINIEFTLNVKIKHISVFCRQMHAVLKTGAPLIKSIEIIKDNTSDKRLRSAVGQLVEAIQRGEMLSQGMKDKPRVFPSLLANMFEAGENSGTLDVVCARMAKHYEKENKIRTKVRSAMMYPVILTLLTVIVAVFLMLFVMPQFTKMFSKSGMELPVVTKFMINTAFNIKKYIFFYTGAFGLGVIFYRYLLTRDKFLGIRDKFKLRTPIFGDLRKKVLATRFSRTMASMMKSGIPIIDTMEVLANTMENQYIKSQLLDGRKRLMRGESISEVIGSIDGFPMMISAMSKIGEEAGELEEIMDKTANFYDDEVEDAIKRMMSMLEPMLIIFMAVVIGFIVISIMIPMFDMSNAINHGL